MSTDFSVESGEQYMESRFSDNRTHVSMNLLSRRIANRVNTPLQIVHVIANFRHRSVKDHRDTLEDNYFKQHLTDRLRMPSNGPYSRERMYGIEGGFIHWARHQVFSTYTFYCLSCDNHDEYKPVPIPKAVTELIKEVPGDIADIISLAMVPAPPLPTESLPELITHLRKKEETHKSESHRTKESRPDKISHHAAKEKFYRQQAQLLETANQRIEAAEKKEALTGQQGLRDERVRAANQLVNIIREDFYKSEAKKTLNLNEDDLLYGINSMSAASIWTPFRIDQNKQTPFLIYDLHLDPNKRKRIISLTLDMWTYSILILHLVNNIKGLIPLIDETEGNLRALIEELKIDGGIQKTNGYLPQLLATAEQIGRFYAHIGGQLGAVSAYAKLVEERIQQLNAEEISGTQSIHTFIMEHILPESRLCAIIQSRLKELSLQNARAIDLVRTKVDFAIHLESQKLLTSLDTNTNINLQMQRVVEILSSIPLTYYACKLISTASGQELGPWKTGSVFVGVCVCIYFAHLFAEWISKKT